MTATTFLAGIVLALGIGFALAALWFRAKTAADREKASQPLADSLTRIEAQIRDLEANRAHMLGGIQANLATLSKETLALGQALRSPNARGRWGELTLRRVAELSGMSPYCDFTEQTSQDGKRPDMMVTLPGGRTLAVDAKAPISGFLEAEAAQDDVQRRAALDRHAQQMWRHVTTLASREYWAQFATTPEMVVLFLPGEQFMGAALERDPELLDKALAKRVMIATPVTLVSILKGVSYGWRQERLARNAEELRKIAGEFQERVRVFGEAYVDLGRQISRSVETYNKSAASWDSRLLPSLKRMQELGVGTALPPEPQRIDTSARLPHLNIEREPDVAGDRPV